MKKIRLDVALVEQGFCTSREKAKAVIMTGNVFVNNERVDKAGTSISVESEIEVKGGEQKYVSRGGLKLEKAIELYSLDLTDCVCMDIGASTGGFTDCMLQNGAKKVYAVDVGYGQLAWKIRSDDRVVDMERTNIRHIEIEAIDPLNFASIDVSFISLKLVLPVLKELLVEEGEALCLVKPQFEAGKEKVGKNGVVRELSTHIEVLEKVYGYLEELEFSLLNATFSPIKGPKGNIEYLYHIKKAKLEDSMSLEQVKEVAIQSHETLNQQT